MGPDAGEDLLPAQYQRLFGTRTGIIKQLFPKPPDRSGPALSTAEPLMTDHERLPGHGYESSISASGKGRSFPKSIVLTVGEAIERYCLRFPPREEFRHATYADLDGREDVEVVDFEYLDIFDVPADAPFDPPSTGTTLEWAAGRNLLNGREVHVPAELVWFVESDAEVDRHFPSTSNATAAGKSVEMALTNALLEAVERDALVRTWLLQRTPARVDLARFPEVHERLQEVFDHDFLDLHLSRLDSRVDLPAVAATVVDERDRYPKFALAGSADVTWRETLVDGGMEAAQSYSFHRNNVPDEDLSLEETITNFTDNTLVYAQPEAYEDVAFLTGDPDDDAVPAGEEGSPSLDWDEKLDRCLSAVAAAGFTPIAFDLTTPDVADVGIRVVRVFVPELLPLPFPSVPPSDHPYLADAPVTERPHPIP